MLDLNHGLSRRILSSTISKQTHSPALAELEELAGTLGINAIHFWEKVTD